ncbi:MAG: PQQ-binding-like beta-propeller repeat protein [Alphaproteobacteria bacterium]|nr:PQQ-binding-like beta-propeller repeat protein [Alphaproteobacteria bacterium]NCQ88704.1 PQQ-binding-like beta-propeller repeat protein [Alphaproteobacteria bacterium]NCT08199.1 PQQ-binding-like beta-propeller repeat protein [Alphaproteobacteria bacterium]
MMKSLLPLFLLYAFIVAGCSTDDDAAPLKGDRISILDLERELINAENTEDASNIVIPAVYKNMFWPQAGGYPSHIMQNMAFTANAPKRIWTADIGDGSGRIPLTAQPIVADGKVFTLDTRSNLSAYIAASGKRLWQASVKSPLEDEEVIGGGIAFSDGTLYVTAGYNEVLAINPNSGEIVWRAATIAPSRAAPTIMQGRVFVSLLNNSVIALNAGNGALIWEYNSIGESAGLLGAASPAADNDIVVPGLSSGDILALRVENGAVAWQDNLSRSLRLGGISGLADIRALPVIDGEIILGISFGGKMAAIDKRTGNRLWQRDITGKEMPWIAGDVVYVLTSENEVIAMNKITGAIFWMTALKKFENAEKREDPIIWTGPVMAGSRLILAGSGGRVAEINPLNGEMIREWKSGKNVRIAPIVANEILYLLGEDGTLLAYQ